MQHYPFRPNKGIYPIITTFFFIIVILFTVLAVIYQGSLVLSVKKAANDDLNNYQVIKDVKDRLYFCYGRVFDSTKLNNNASCEINSQLIRGYIISEYSYGNCTAKNWTHYTVSPLTMHSEMYVVPIYDNDLVCPGKVQVFI